MENPTVPLPVFTIEEDIMDIDFINDFHSTFTLLTLTAPSIVKLLIDNAFSHFKLDNIGYEFADAVEGKVLLKDIIRKHKDELIEESSTLLTFHRVGSHYVVQGSEKILQTFYLNGVFSTDVDLKIVDNSSTPDYTTLPINDLVENTLNLLIEEPNLKALENSEYPAWDLYRYILSDIASYQEYFAYKAIDGLRENIATSNIESTDEQINLAVDKTKNDWTKLFPRPILGIYDDAVAIEESFIHGTREQFLKFFPEIFITDEAYVNILIELGFYEEF